MNIWAPRYGTQHSSDSLNFNNIRHGFIDNYLNPSKYEQVKPMIIFGITLGCIWNAHWKHVRNNADREDFIKVHVANSIRSQLFDRIVEELTMKIRVYRWLKIGIVEKRGSLMRINLPAFQNNDDT